MASDKMHLGVILLLFTILDNEMNYYHFCEYNLKHIFGIKRLVLIIYIVIGKIFIAHGHMPALLYMAFLPLACCELLQLTPSKDSIYF